MYFWKNITKIIAGIHVINAPAPIWFQEINISAIKSEAPTERFFEFEVGARIRLYKNSFQVPRKVIIELAATPGRAKGKAILKKVCNRELPSILAASSNSFGIVSKNPILIQIVKGSHIYVPIMI